MIFFNISPDFQKSNIVLVQKLFAVIADGGSDYNALILARLRSILETSLNAEIDRRIEIQHVIPLTEKDSTFFFRETAFVHKLQKTTLNLCPVHRHFITARAGEMQRFRFSPSVFVRKPCRCTPLPAMFPHVREHSVPAFKITVPMKKRFVNVLLCQLRYRLSLVVIW